MEEALDQVEAPLPSASTKNFALGIAASVVLHLAAAAILLSLPQGPQMQQSVTYVDLANVQPPPTAVPKDASPPDPQLAEPEEPELSEEPAVKETAPEQTAQAQQPTPPTPPAAQELPKTTLGIGLTKGFFETLGNGETLRDDIREYYLALLERVNQKWWMDPQVHQRVSAIVVDITVARNGEIVESRVLNSSGDRRYDRAVLAALASAGPLPPLPMSYQMEFFQAPIRLVPPLNLMAW